LNHLILLHEIEQNCFRRVTQLQEISRKSDTSTRDESNDISYALQINKPLGRNVYLPLRPKPNSRDWEQWKDVPKANFYNPSHWEQLSQLKDKLDVGSDRSFQRDLKALRQFGLRTLPANKNRRIKLYYRPDLASALEKWRANSYSITKVTYQHIEQVDSANSHEGSTTAQLPTNQQTIFSPAPILEAVSKLQQEQQNLQQQYLTLLDKMSRIEDALNLSQNLNH